MELQSLNVHQAQAPGCYGAPSVYSNDSKVCQACPVFDECSMSCMDNLKILRETIDVSDFMRRHAIAKKGIIATQANTDLQNLRFMPSIKAKSEPVKRETKVERMSCEVPEDLQNAINQLCKKPMKEALTLVKNGMHEFIKSELAQGRSPYASIKEPNTKSVLCDELLKGVVTKESLKKAYMKHLGRKTPWTEASASANTGIFLDAFECLGIITVTKVDIKGKALEYSLNAKIGDAHV